MSYDLFLDRELAYYQDQNEMSDHLSDQVEDVLASGIMEILETGHASSNIFDTEAVHMMYNDNDQLLSQYNTHEAIENHLDKHDFRETICACLEE